MKVITVIKFIMKFIRLFLILLPVGFLTLLIEGGIPLNPEKIDWIVFILICFISTIIGFILDYYFSQKELKKNQSNKD